MQVVDVAGVADNADVSLKFSIDGTPVEHTAEFTTEDEYVKEGFDGYFDLVAGDNFDATLEGEHMESRYLTASVQSRLKANSPPTPASRRLSRTKS